MKNRLELAILPQPDETTCGPTCLHALYRYHGDEAELGQVVREVPQLRGGGTFAVLLGCHALARGYTAELFTYNLQVFDPTWFAMEPAAVVERLGARRAAKGPERLKQAIDGYAQFLRLGGAVRFQDLTAGLIQGLLAGGTPVIAGLSSTYLYRSARESGRPPKYDDVKGDPQGHFVVLCGYDKDDRTVLLADPLHPSPHDKPAFEGLRHVVEIDRVICAILLGILTHDADLLVLRPGATGPGNGTGDRACRR